MLKTLQDKSTPTCLVTECGGAITAGEYRDWIAAMDAAIEAAGPGKASAVFIMASAPRDADWEALEADFSGIKAYRELGRVAYVGDVAWLNRVIDAFGWITKAQEKTFTSAQTDEALAWACEG